MAFRSIDPDVAHQLAEIQARREASRQRVAAGERMRADADVARRALATPPVELDDMRDLRCERRLDDGAPYPGWRALGSLLVFLPGLVVAIGALGSAVDGGSWAHVAIGVLGLGWAMFVRTILLRPSRLEAFRAELRALPFPIVGAEDTLGFTDELAEITAIITPVDDLPIDTVANLIGLIAPDVRIGVGSSGTAVSRRDHRIEIVRRFKIFTSSKPAPAQWLLALIRTALLPLHDLHAIARVELAAAGD